MENIKIVSNSPASTISIAKKLAKFLSKGDIVVLTGDLGSGKTKFVEGFLSNFNLQDEISSPTFNIVNEYSSKYNNIYHFDVYRLADSDEFYAIGGEEYFDRGICLIEWGEIIQDVLPESYIEILFSKDQYNENTRFLTFKIQGFSKHYIDIINKFKEGLI